MEESGEEKRPWKFTEVLRGGDIHKAPQKQEKTRLFGQSYPCCPCHLFQIHRLLQLLQIKWNLSSHHQLILGNVTIWQLKRSWVLILALPSAGGVIVDWVMIMECVLHLWHVDYTILSQVLAWTSLSRRLNRHLHSISDSFLLCLSPQSSPHLPIETVVKGYP